MRIDNMIDIMVAVRNTFSSPLTEYILFTWHKMLLQKQHKSIQVHGEYIKSPCWLFQEPWARKKFILKARQLQKYPWKCGGLLNGLTILRPAERRK